MVKAKQDRRKRDIKSKLMAAIAMLLVSSIMMVSSTYAWFTLSTAPEVTGITTAVGANGNLEMALMPASGLTADIKSSAGDSMTVKTDALANVTWGNLVDLSDSDTYGLNLLTLFPAALNVTAKDSQDNVTQFNTQSILQTPTYGFDGRVETLSSAAIATIYDVGHKNFPGSTITNEDTGKTPKLGVRAIGIASGMTTEQLAYRNARGAASTAMLAAQRLAAQSLSDSGSALATIAVLKAAGTNDGYGATHVAAMRTIVDDLTVEGGVLDTVEEAYLQYLYALSLSQEAVEAGVTYEKATELLAAARAAEAAGTSTALAYFRNALSSTGVTLDAKTTAGLDALAATRTTVLAAETKLEALEAEVKTAETNGTTASFTWNEIYAVLQDLADPDAMLVNGMTVNHIKENMSDLVSTIGGGIFITMSSGGGVYADVADHCGDYDAYVELEDIEFKGIDMGGMAVTMQTKTTPTYLVDGTETSVGNSYLGAFSGVVVAAKQPTSATGDLPLSDFYGYIIDLAFRTNAANSSLLLQTEAVDRIYEGTSGVEDESTGNTTMGNGSTMKFTVADAGLGVDGLKELTGAIRIIFFDPDTGTVYANAGLDSTKITSAASSYELPIYLYEYKAVNTGVYKETAYTGTVLVSSATTEGGEDKITYKVYDADNNEVTDVNASDFYVLTTAATENTPAAYTALTDLTTAQTATKLYTAETETQRTQLTGDEASITQLVQNTAKKVSVLVYLDGNTITNASVAATAATSMSGTLNLQFASSATLTPMEYADLKGQPITNNGGTNSGTTTPSTPTEYYVVADGGLYYKNGNSYILVSDYTAAGDNAATTYPDVVTTDKYDKYTVDTNGTYYRTDTGTFVLVSEYTEGTTGVDTNTKYTKATA